VDRKLKSLALGIVVFVALFAMIAPVQALPTVYGYVYGPDGVTPIDGVEVTATNMNTGHVESVTTPMGASGLYEMRTLPSWPGDKIKVVATYGDLVASATITVPDEWAPTRLDLTLHSVAPTLTPLGLVALVGLLSAIAAVTITRRKRR
jgi:hypothetical protein